MSIPNSVGIRNLYDLPLEGGTLDVSIDKDNNAGNLQEQMDYCGTEHKMSIIGLLLIITFKSYRPFL